MCKRPILSSNVKIHEEHTCKKTLNVSFNTLFTQRILRRFYERYNIFDKKKKKKDLNKATKQFYRIYIHVICYLTELTYLKKY